MTTTRAADPSALTIDRTIPLWGIVGFLIAIAGQALVMWNGQAIQAAELRHQSEQIRDMAAQLKNVSDLLGKKDAIDVKQDLRIDELERRLLTIEQVKGSR